jgi:hypothetical protein
MPISQNFTVSNKNKMCVYHCHSPVIEREPDLLHQSAPVPEDHQVPAHPGLGHDHLAGWGLT